MKSHFHFFLFLLLGATLIISGLIIILNFKPFHQYLVPSETSEFKTYINVAGNFEITYPQNWQILQDTDSGLRISNKYFDPAWDGVSPIPGQIFVDFLYTGSALENYSPSPVESISTEGVALIKQGKFLDSSNSFGIVITYRKNDPNLKKILKEVDQILTSFKYSGPAEIQNWKTYTNTKYSFETKYHPESAPTENSRTDDIGQFSYLLAVDFGTNPLKSKSGYTVRINNQRSINDFRLELIGHITDKIDSESNLTLNNIVWKKLNYQIFLTTANVPLTLAITNYNKFSYAITSSSLDIDQILSTFKFLKTPSLSPATTSIFNCPANGWVDCMPGPDSGKSVQCSSEAQNWYKSNCPNFQGIAY